MADVFSRRNALVGWVVWSVAKRRLRARVRGEKGAPRRRVLRAATAVAVLAALAAVWAKRRGGGEEQA
jgi:hypothetical protein